MAELISREGVPVEVDYYGLAVEDWDDSQIPVPFPEDWEQGPFLTTHPGRLSFTSAGHTHTATMTFEVWDQEAPEPPGDWEESALTELACTSGKLQARGLASGPWPDPVRLSDKPGTWTVRVVCGGRADVAAQAQDEAVEAVEQYLLQFWQQA
ncbi:hypothetical protein [Streptomyces flavofungini]|uniref:Uncharacterized protein n=1 Tax=Streptomyces flavofungini TaxID=68200 RepID=A0ABS0WXA2_9ACTN|nr:hypothetical protein [Streptomyces flavofungini]MBJ3805556.1 hypothetical protein [Streptomyces flavofungini]GHC73197.1 hypothetical protein GCM10010349_50730 [Streptomyces flavofungini]